MFTETTDFFDPPLTIINQDPRKLGSESAKLLLEEIENETVNQSRLLIDEEFLWRRSIRSICNAVSPI
jgi:DNA-binding LacI/PurR family transcriptional regulator